MNSLFRVSERNHAGLIFMTRLAERHAEDGFIRLQDVAEEMGISLAYLEEIAVTLKAAGLIEGKKGPNGGYKLNVKPEDITAERIITALEGPVALVDCQKMACPVKDKCSSKSLWNFLQKSVLETLRETTLEDIAKQNV